METEIWKDIKGYEGLYQVSNFGNIMSLNYNHTGKPILMKISKDKGGYLLVCLSKNGKSKRLLVHRLVAETFLPNPENKLYINHKIEGDEGKTMNMVIFNEDCSINKEKSTIEWVTAKENTNYGTRNERVSKKMTNGKLSKPVLQLSLTGDLIREWPSVNECGRNNYNIGNVAACCRGEKPHYKGYIWRYK